MPLSSMTGFGQAELSTPSGTYRVEIRSTNNRFLDIQTRIPHSFNSVESDIKKLVSSNLARGSVIINIFWSRENESLGWNRSAVENYMSIFNEIKKNYKLKDEITLSNLLTISDFIQREPGKFDDRIIWRNLKRAIVTALEDLIRFREKEASYIISDLKKTVKSLSKTLYAIERRSPVRLKHITSEFREKIENLAGKRVDPSRLSFEVAMMADRYDISEECTRLHAHIEKMNSDFNSNGPAGKRLGFLLQEMNREANTIASKANDTKISQLSVILKENIEKIREQVLNIE